jgi:hypothetical protein
MNAENGTVYVENSTIDASDARYKLCNDNGLS